MNHWAITALPDRVLPAEWSVLHAQGGHVLSSPLFVQALLDVFGHDQIYLARATTAGQPRALLLLERQATGRWQSWQPSQSPITVGIGLGQLQVEDWQALCRQLPGFALMLSVLHLDPHIVPRLLARPGIGEVDYIRTAWVELTTDFETYWAARGKNLRQNINKCYNRLEREGITPRLVRVRDVDQMATAVAEYGRIEAGSWKAGGGTAITPENDQGRFYTRIMRSFAERQGAEVWQLWYGERCVASDLCIEDGQQLIILKTTYDEAEAKSSPAQLMRYEAFRALAADARISRIEFFGRMMEWHGRLTEQSRVLYHLNVYRWGWLERLHARRRGASIDSSPVHHTAAPET